MKDFDITTLCVKCGYRNASITYRVGQFDPAGQENISTVRFGGTGEGHLLRTCQRCGYKWPERTIDMHGVSK
uniref:Uncharacterized protein n=1 Tax=viral metagenome TaxID=1070528 RepID=A0A6H2A2V7_9ZZZZ